MRLWSLHPRYLDPQGLVALWREALLAQAVILGKTRGYRQHPQLHRFLQARDPVKAIGAYLTHVHEEATLRGYRFDAEKIHAPNRRARLCVTDGQLDHETTHLRAKLKARSPQLAGGLKGVCIPHPMFRVRTGPVADWERVAKQRGR